MVILIWTLNAATAAAQCAKDTDCKGDRICSAGVCVDPDQVNRAPAAIDPRISAPADADAGWTTPAGIIGLVGAAAAVGLIGGAAASLDNDSETDSILGGAGLLTVAILNPIVAVGAHSGDERGSVGLEIASWVAYGITIVNGIALLAIGDAEDDVTEPLTIATGALAGVSLATMAASALIAGSKSRAAVARGPSPTIAPSVAIVRDVEQRTRPALGLSARF